MYMCIYIYISNWSSENIYIYIYILRRPVTFHTSLTLVQVDWVVYKRNMMMPFYMYNNVIRHNQSYMDLEYAALFDYL